MKKEDFVNYIDFLQKAFEKREQIKSFKYYDNRLFSFKTSACRYNYLYNNGVLTPNKFVAFLGFNNYNAFVNKRFSKLKEFATKEDYKKWYGGFFGGLIGVNRHIINDYVGSGEIFKFYDYDINKAYLHALTGWLPTKFIKTISFLDFQQLDEMEKIPYFYFFEIELKIIKSQFLKAIGKIKEIYKSFDFLNSKQYNKIIVSEKRLNLINQIYFKDYEIKKVFVFERGKFKFYENILEEYLKVKDIQGEKFKENALRLYGTLGQIYKYKATKIKFDKDGTIRVNYKQEVNENANPQVAMWVADSVAERLFNIISSNYENIICWNTDGLTSLKPLNLRINKKPGYWKLKEFDGLPFLQNETGARLFFKNVKTGEFIGATNIVEKDGKIYEVIKYNYSNYKKGFVEVIKNFEIKVETKFDEMKTLRNLILKEKFIKEISREYEQF